MTDKEESALAWIASEVHCKKLNIVNLEMYCKHQPTVDGAKEDLEAMETVLSIVRAALQPSGWMPIESAPRDGTYVLCYSPAHRIEVRYRMLQWDEEMGGWYHPDGCEILIAPTHWQPLPLPPAAALPKPGQEG